MTSGPPYLEAVLASLAAEAPWYTKSRAPMTSGAIDLSAGEIRIDVSGGALRPTAPKFEATDFCYQDPRGLPVLRKTYLRSVTGFRGDGLLEAANVLVTSGAKHALWLAFMLLVKPNGLVLLPSPGWPPYRVWARALGARIATYDASQPNVATQILQGLHEDVSVLIINVPNNPTGSEITQNDVRRIVDRASEVGAGIVSDEVYREFAREPASLLDYVDREDVEVLVADSVSKSTAAAGLRVGFLVARPALIDDALALRSVVDSCPPGVTQRVANSLLDVTAAPFRAALRQRAASDIESLRSCLEEHGLEVASSGGIYIWVRLADNDQQVRLGDATLAGCPGENFQAPGYVRLCPVTDEPAFLHLLRSQGVAG